MKQLKSFCAAAVLALALCIPVYAGDIDTPGYVPPPPPPPAAHMVGDTGTEPGDISSPAETSSDLLVSFLLSMISLY